MIATAGGFGNLLKISGYVTIKCGKYYLSEIRFIKNIHGPMGSSIFN